MHIQEAADRDKQNILHEELKNLLNSKYKTKYTARSEINNDISFEISFEKHVSFKMKKLIDDLRKILEERMKHPISIFTNLPDPYYIDQGEYNGEEADDDDDDDEDEDEDDDFPQNQDQHYWIGLAFCYKNPHNPSSSVVEHAYHENNMVKQNYPGIKYYDYFREYMRYWVAQPPDANIGITSSVPESLTYVVHIRNDELRKLVATAFHWHGASILADQVHMENRDYFEVKIPKEYSRTRRQTRTNRSKFFSMFPFLQIPQIPTGRFENYKFIDLKAAEQRPDNFVEAMRKRIALKQINEETGSEEIVGYKKEFVYDTK